MSDHCQRCGESYDLTEKYVATMFCDVCAQQIVEKLARLVPKPGRGITYDRGMKIICAVRDEIRNRPHATRGAK